MKDKSVVNKLAEDITEGLRNLADSDAMMLRLRENYELGQALGISDDASHLIGFFIGKLARRVDRESLKEYMVDTIDLVYDTASLGGN